MLYSNRMRRPKPLLFDPMIRLKITESKKYLALAMLATIGCFEALTLLSASLMGAPVSSINVDKYKTVRYTKGCKCLS